MSNLEEALSRLDLYIQQQMRAAGTPGLALAFTDREGLVHQAFYGYASVAARTPVQPETLFEIGSISKSFTAIALLQLVEAGRLDLHAPVTVYLPWFRVPSEFPPITTHHLLTHSAGIIRGTDFSTEGRYEVWALRETEATSPPGTRFYYSNVGYKALGLVLERLTSQDYGTAIQQRILDPLGMADSEPVISHETRRRLAVAHEFLYDDRPPHPSQPLAPATWVETATGDGSIAATAADMAAYLRMLINAGRGPAGPILSPEGFSLLVQRAIEQPEDEDHPGAEHYGYGLDVSEKDGHKLIGHGGGMVGHYAFVLADLDDGLGVVVLVNGPGEPGIIASYALTLLRAGVHGEPLPDLPEAPDPARVGSAADYAGTYRSPTTEFSLEALEGKLVMHTGGEWVELEKRGTDSFYVPHPDWALYLLQFGREEGQVVEASFGPDWFAGERYTGPTEFAAPSEWAPYPGHYRSHNPWYSNLRVIQRKGRLWLVQPSGEEEPLASLGEGVFRAGDEEDSPERLRLDTVVDGKALRANLSGCDYYRTFTP